MLLELEDSVIGHTRSSELCRYVEHVFTEQAGMEIILETAYYEVGKEKDLENGERLIAAKARHIWANSQKGREAGSAAAAGQNARRGNRCCCRVRFCRGEILLRELRNFPRGKMLLPGLESSKENSLEEERVDLALATGSRRMMQTRI